jgi:hypothetical protein
LENPGLFLDVLERFMSERYPVKGQLHV